MLAFAREVALALLLSTLSMKLTRNRYLPSRLTMGQKLMRSMGCLRSVTTPSVTEGNAGGSVPPNAR